MECYPYESNYAQGGIECLEPTGSQQEMDDKRWIPSGDGSRQNMDCDRIWMDDRRWITGYG